MSDRFLKIKNWQLFLLLSNYWLISIVIQSDSVLLDILLIVNIGLLFGWYYLVINKLNSILNLKFIYLYNLTALYLLGYMITEIIPLRYEVLDLVIWKYVAILGYLFAVGYAAACFVKAEEKKGIKSGSFLLTFVLFFIYPVGVFFIPQRLTKLLTL